MVAHVLTKRIVSAVFALLASSAAFVRVSASFIYLTIISDKEIIFLFVCFFVCLYISSITQIMKS